MANTIKIKRSTGSLAPTTLQLTAGELGLAEGSNILYYNKAGTIIKVGGTGVRLNDWAAPDGAVTLNNQRITNLATPISDADAATKGYVDAARSGLDVKGSVRASTTANLTLSGLLTVDGVSLDNGDRVLVKNQTTASQNGIYTVVTGGAWIRATDADSDAEVTPGLFVFVEEGTVNADTGWVLSNNGAVVVGTTALTFTQFSSAGLLEAGDGLTKSGNILAVGTTASTALGRLVVEPNTVALEAIIGGASTWTKTTFDAFGRATTGTNPTEFEDLGLTGGTLNHLSIVGNTVLEGDLEVSDGHVSVETLSASGEIEAANVTTGAVYVANTLAVQGTTNLVGNVTAGGHVTAASLGTTGSLVTLGTFHAFGATTLVGLTAGASTLASLGVTGGATVGGSLGVTGALSTNSTFAATGASNFYSTLGVTGAATFNSTLSAGASTLASLSVTGSAGIGANLGVTGTLTAGASTLASLGVTGATSVGGNLGVTGTLSLTGVASFLNAVSIVGFADFSADLNVDGNTTLSTLAASGAVNLASTLGVVGNITGSNLILSGYLDGATIDGGTWS